MMFEMATPAKPYNLKRFTVIGMVGLWFRCGTLAAFIWFRNTAITDGVTNSAVCYVFLWVLFASFPLVLCYHGFSFRRFQSFVLIFCVLLAFHPIIFSNIFFCTLFAFVEVSVCHCWMLVKLVQWFCFATFKTNLCYHLPSLSTIHFRLRQFGQAFGFSVLGIHVYPHRKQVFMKSPCAF